MLMKKILTAFLLLWIGAGAEMAATAIADKYAPATRSAALIRICPTKSQWVLWFNSDNKPVLEQVTPDNAAALGARARRLPDTAKVILDIPCVRETY